MLTLLSCAKPAVCCARFRAATDILQIVFIRFIYSELPRLTRPRTVRARRRAYSTRLDVIYLSSGRSSDRFGRVYIIVRAQLLPVLSSMIIFLRHVYCLVVCRCCYCYSWYLITRRKNKCKLKLCSLHLYGRFRTRARRSLLIGSIHLSVDLQECKMDVNGVYEWAAFENLRRLHSLINEFSGGSCACRASVSLERYHPATLRPSRLPGNYSIRTSCMECHK